jgi:ketosteroid isomerase-like protein
VTTPAVALVREMMGPVYGPDLVALVGDPERLRAARDHFARFVHPDLEVEMVFAAEASPHRGAEALIEAWRELLSVFSSYRSGLEEVVDAGDGVVGLFSRDTVATAEGIEMTISTGAVYEVEDGRVRRARYFPDQTAARAAIG